MIKLTNVNIVAGQFSLENISLTIPEGEFGVLMGKTGSGKTTILESICGLRKIKSGIISLCNNDVTNRPPRERGIGFVPQDGALFYTMTIYDNIAFALKLLNWPKDIINKRVTALAQRLEISHLLNRTPKGLSGGEQQRVALGRALAFSPKIICFDEPLAALDDETHDSICILIKEITKKEKITALHITHSQREAERLGDIIFKIQNGKIKKIKKIKK